MPSNTVETSLPNDDENPPLLPPPRSLKINKKTDHFFISINKKGVHSFIMLGMYDPAKNKIQNLLCRVGKMGNNTNPNYVTNIQSICNALFFSNKSRLGDEGVWREKLGANPISYQAYDITYDQYLDFVQKLESLQTPDNKFGCYKPVILKEPEEEEQLGDSPEPAVLDPDQATLTYSEDNVLLPSDVSKIKKSVSELSVRNTCRHSAIALVEEVQHAPVGSLVSSSFFMELPYRTLLVHGKPSEDIPFYVLPAPPTAFAQIADAQQKIVNKLYIRMENMLCLEPDSEDTQAKFLKLKELYLDLVGPKKKLSLDSLLQHIETWKSDNQATLEVLRKTYFWDSFVKRTSSTMKLIDEIEDDLEKTRQLHHG
ncbi:Uncharacterised protein [Legionella steigerwaltii]|uniref:Uncharacterized protein n=1 Tax=Legionella steigerwaltii TaxID=460 RepID=A0A378L8N3_9GAMM|nr:hypothetical protein [Legionella steigerwaltii]KTD77435.1 hypothetical protein Lstg_1792 [Legionella steigerwaltii]STY22710.1 Uncharacterised protein [Legionella steigerwaltii]